MKIGHFISKTAVKQATLCAGCNKLINGAFDVETIKSDALPHKCSRQDV